MNEIGLDLVVFAKERKVGKMYSILGEKLFKIIFLVVRRDISLEAFFLLT